MNKETLLAHIEHMTPEQIELLGGVVSLANGWDYNLKVKLCGISEAERRKIDSAIPCDYADRIRDIYPDFSNGHHVYDYNNKTFGEMVNMNNLLVRNLLLKLKLW